MRAVFMRTALSGALLAHGAALFARPPEPVSPGVGEEATVEVRCPTFSWAPAMDVGAQELVVYRLAEDPGAEAEVVVGQKLPAAASSWTPAGDACLERGARYAWSVRGLEAGASGEWSTGGVGTVHRSRQAWRTALGWGTCSTGWYYFGGGSSA